MPRRPDLHSDTRALARSLGVHPRPGPRRSGDALALLELAIDDALELHLDGAVARIEVEICDDHVRLRHDGPGPSPRALTDVTLQIAKSRLGRLVALARRVELDVARHGARRRWVFEAGRTIRAGDRIAAAAEPGVAVRIWPGPTPLIGAERAQLELSLLDVHRLRPQLRVELDGAGFDEPAGVAAWLASQRACRELEQHRITARRGRTELELAWAWLPAMGAARRLSYVNFGETTGDGSHVDGLLDALTRVHGVSRAMARERTLALVSVIAINPRYAGPDRTRLHDPALGRWIAELVEARATIPSTSR